MRKTADLNLNQDLNIKGNVKSASKNNFIMKNSIISFE
jgi:hypothetical protein